MRFQSAIDRLQSAAYELVLDGDSYRHRQRPTPGTPVTPSTVTPQPPASTSHLTVPPPVAIIAASTVAEGRRVVPCHWRKGGPFSLAGDTGPGRDGWR